jgi:hypothetical protein
MASKPNFEKIRANIKELAEGFVGRVAQAGWFPGAVYESGTPAAYVAAIQEYGSPANGIPPRPFVRVAIAEHQHEWSAAMAQGARAVLRGRMTADQVLEQVGSKVASDIQLQIETGDHAPLSPVTLMLRKWRREGRTITGKTVGEAAAAVAEGEDYSSAPTTPLRDTGMLIATLTHAVSDE